MNFNDYQQEAAKTAIYPDQFAIMYPALGVAAEAGEVANKVKKVYRDNGGKLTEEARMAIADELGDVVWYLANLANDLAISFDTIASRNLEKLRSRMERGVLQGSGDTR